MTLSRRGVAFGVAAYLIWGLFPLYWPLLDAAGALEILAHRVTWSLAVMLLVLSVLRGWGAIRAMPARTWLIVVAAATLIAVNWGVYIWAVNNGRVLDAALGYFLNPLISVLIGVLALRERLSALQWCAVGVGTVAMAVIAVGSDRVPWAALVLATTFAAYGLAKKLVPLTPTVSLTAEGLVLIVPAAAFLVVLQAQGGSSLATGGPLHVALLIGSGVVTCVPLLCFAAAARALPLSVLGLLQYLTPVVQFLLGVLWAGESMPPTRWVGFSLVWAALTLLTADALRRHGGAPAAQPVAQSAPADAGVDVVGPARRAGRS